MVFWIVLIIMVVLFFLVLAWELSDVFMGVSLYLIPVFAIILLFYAGAASTSSDVSGLPINSEVSTEYSLEAIGTASSGEEFFVLSGQKPGGSRTFSFIAPSNGTQFLNEAPAADSEIRIVNEGTKPSVIVTTYVYENPVWVPWTVGERVTYEFFVPASGVLEDYAVGN